MSWNWAAFFATFAWLRYRGLYAWSWLYAFVSTPALLVYAMLLSARDSCEAALDPPQAPIIVLCALLALGWIVPPLVAAKLPHRDGAKASIAGALALQAIVVVLTAIAVPSYGSYIYRSRVTEGLSVAMTVRTALAEYVKARGRLPSRIEELAPVPTGPYVSRIELKSDGAIRATFGEAAQRLAAHSVVVAPTLDRGEIVAWSCSSDLPDRCLPASCRSRARGR